MTAARAASFVSTLALAFVAAGCDPDAADVRKAGYTALDQPDRTVACFDYTGNKTMEIKNAGDVTLYVSEGSATVKDKSGNPVAFASGGAGCYVDSYFYDRKNREDEQKIAAIPSKLVVALSNGSDRIVLAGRFTHVSTSSSSPNELTVSDNGTTLRSVKFFGLTSVGARDNAVINPEIVKAMGLN